MVFREVGIKTHFRDIVLSTDVKWCNLVYLRAKNTALSTFLRSSFQFAYPVVIVLKSIHLGGGLWRAGRNINRSGSWLSLA